MLLIALNVQAYPALLLRNVSEDEVSDTTKLNSSYAAKPQNNHFTFLCSVVYNSGFQLCLSPCTCAAQLYNASYSFMPMVSMS